MRETSPWISLLRKKLVTKHMRERRGQVDTPSVMMMMMMNCFCRMVDRQKALSLISVRDYCQSSSPLQISDMPRAGFQPAKSPSSDFVK